MLSITFMYLVIIYLFIYFYYYWSPIFFIYLFIYYYLFICSLSCYLFIYLLLSSDHSSRKIVIHLFDLIIWSFIGKSTNGVWAHIEKAERKAGIGRNRNEKGNWSACFLFGSKFFTIKPMFSLVFFFFLVYYYHDLYDDWVRLSEAICLLLILDHYWICHSLCFFYCFLFILENDPTLLVSL